MKAHAKARRVRKPVGDVPSPTTPRIRIAPGEPVRPNGEPLPIAKQCPCCSGSLQTATRKVRSLTRRAAVEKQVKIKICAKCGIRIVLHRFPPKMTSNDSAAEWPPSWLKEARDARRAAWGVRP